jgi:transcriptional regulator with XRE-family HTH domain
VSEPRDDPENAATVNDLARRIARLVEEKGWNQEDFARISQLNRHTVRQILNAGPERRLRNATVSQCAGAFGLSVAELRTAPIGQLLLRVRGRAAGDEGARRLLEEGVAMPELADWLDRNPARRDGLQAAEAEELLAMQSPGGGLERDGVETAVARIERRRELLERVRVVAGSEYAHLLEQFVELLHEKVAGASGDRA